MIYCCPAVSRRNPWLQSVQCNFWKTFKSHLCFHWRINGSDFFLSVSWTMFPVLCIFFSRLLREQWIRAKYERKEFIHSEKQEPYSAGSERHFWLISFFVVQPLPFSSSLFICSLCWLLPISHWIEVSMVLCTRSLLVTIGHKITGRGHAALSR